ncbi:thrombospondin type-1 domain-containing protein [Desulfonema limicola]|uniref:thrombospondin type-1 domain-containing protein n=1 Tax=Desulfonema limicola TaxID=45656 RepID=UPI001CA470E1
MLLAKSPELDDVYKWQTGNWSYCSNKCGDGIQTRTVQCTDKNGNVVSDSYCTAARPDDDQTCSDNSDCPVDSDDGGGGGGCFINNILYR